MKELVTMELSFWFYKHNQFAFEVFWYQIQIRDSMYGQIYFPLQLSWARFSYYPDL